MKSRIATLATAAAVAALAANGIYGAVKGSDSRPVPDYAKAAAIQTAYGTADLPPELPGHVAARTHPYVGASPELLDLGAGAGGPR